MRIALVLIAWVPFLSGCLTHQSLRQNTIRTTTTLTDIYYQQVLDNVARFVVNPSVMPSFAVVNAGTVTVLDQNAASAGITYNPTLNFNQPGGGPVPFLALLFSPNISRSLTENWSLCPVTDVDNLRRLRCAFELLVVGRETTECENCKELLRQFYPGECDRLDCLIPRGWFGVGGKKDVPKCACYVGRCCDTYVWVPPECMEGLTRFTLTILDLATGKPHVPTRNVVKSYDAGGKLISTQVTTTEIDPEALARLHKMRECERPRACVTPLVNPGYFFVPR